MERGFHSQGLGWPLVQASLLHALLIFTGLLPALRPRPQQAPDPEPFADLEVQSLDPLEAARLLSMGAAQSAPSLADLPRQSSTRPQSGPLDLQLPEFPQRPGAARLAQPRHGSPSRRLLEGGAAPLRERSAIETLERRVSVDAGQLHRPLELPRSSLERVAPALTPPRLIELQGRALGALTLYREEPRLSPALLAAGAAGMVWIEMRVDPEGLVQEALVVEGSGNEGLDQAALAAARRWRFDPLALEKAGSRRCRYRFRIDAQAGPGGG